MSEDQRHVKSGGELPHYNVTGIVDAERKAGHTAGIDQRRPHPLAE